MTRTHPVRNTLIFAALLYVLLCLAHWIGGVAHADPAAPVVATPAGPDWTFYVAMGLAALGGLKAIIDAALGFFAWLAPRTESKFDDTARDDLQLVHDKLDAVLHVVGGLVPATGVPRAKESGFIARPLLLGLSFLGLMAIAVAGSGCAGAGATVKKEASYLEGCSAADAAQIINAGKAIADDAKSIKAGGDKATAAIDTIAQLALIQAAWQHCKSTAGAPATGMP